MWTYRPECTIHFAMAVQMSEFLLGTVASVSLKWLNQRPQYFWLCLTATSCSTFGAFVYEGQIRVLTVTAPKMHGPCSRGPLFKGPFVQGVQAVFWQMDFTKLTQVSQHLYAQSQLLLQLEQLTVDLSWNNLTGTLPTSWADLDKASRSAQQRSLVIATDKLLNATHCFLNAGCFRMSDVRCRYQVDWHPVANAAVSSRSNPKHVGWDFAGIMEQTCQRKSLSWKHMLLTHSAANLKAAALPSWCLHIMLHC